MAITRRERPVPEWADPLAGRLPWPQWLTDWEPWRSLWEERQHIRVEEYTEGDRLVVRAELPGVDPDRDISVTVDHGMLRIHAERREEEASAGRRFRRTELRYGAFTRELPLPPEADEEDVRAAYRDGILTVSLPLGTSGEKKEIPIARG